jgi:hypothetical protein
VLAFAYSVASAFWRQVRFEQFGNDPLDLEKSVRLASIMLEITAKLFRGQWRPPKGRIDGERIELTNFIQKYACPPLRPLEIRDALIYAGFSIPDGDTFRVWLHRARKKGQVDFPQPPPREISVALKPDGTIDCSSLDANSLHYLALVLRRSPPGNWRT